MNNIVKQLKDDKPVFQLDKEGNILNRYESVSEASKKTYNSIKKILHHCNKEKVFKNLYRWCYVENYEIPKNTVYFSKIKESAKIPYKRNTDAGYDIYACFEEDYIMIPPHESKMIPTGISSAISKDYVFILKERGSTGTKNIGLRSGVIDSNYRGEWFICLSNHSDTWLFITKIKKEDLLNRISLVLPDGTKISDNKQEYGVFYDYEKAICQAILVEVPKVYIQNIPYKYLEEIPSIRGKGKLGSSNK